MVGGENEFVGGQEGIEGMQGQREVGIRANGNGNKPMRTKMPIMEIYTTTELDLKIMSDNLNYGRQPTALSSLDQLHFGLEVVQNKFFGCSRI